MDEHIDKLRQTGEEIAMSLGRTVLDIATGDDGTSFYLDHPKGASYYLRVSLDNDLGKILDTPNDGPVRELIRREFESAWKDAQE